MTLLNELSNKAWGRNVDFLLHIYRSTIRTKLNYASFVYGSSRVSSLRQLDTVHHEGIRLCTGLFRTSLVESLYIIAHDKPLWLRRDYIGMSYVVRLATVADNQAFSVVFYPSFFKLFEKRPSLALPFGLRIQQKFLDSKIDAKHVTAPPSVLPPWEGLSISCDLTLIRFN